LQRWLSGQSDSLINNQYLKEALSLLDTVLNQNIEPDPDGGSKIIRGVSTDRRISISDSDMRHGRKSSSR
ncbi:TPA: IS5/IS1182 family transposase, partial [Legionella pneumophila]